MIKLKYSKNTVGCNVGGDIYVHPDLYNYPKLYKAILMHEAKHSNGFKLSDVAVDFFNEDLRGHKKEFYKFILKHPRVLLGWLPVTKIGKQWTFDIEMAAAWLLAILVIWFIGGHL